MSGEWAMPDPRYIDGTEYAARNCDWLGIDYRTEPYPGQGKVAAAARGCAYAIRARLVQAMDPLKDARLGDPLLSVYESDAMSALRLREFDLPATGGGDAMFLRALESAASQCDDWRRLRPDDDAAIRRCAATIRAQARAFTESAPPLSPASFEALRRARPGINKNAQGAAAA